MQNLDSASNLNPANTENNQRSTSSENSSVIEIPQASPVNTNKETVINSQSGSIQSNPGQSQSQSEINNKVGTVSSVTPCGFQMEKTKLPKFSGDVREYVIFRADFKHAFESRYVKRDAITLLRTCLKDN